MPELDPKIQPFTQSQYAVDSAMHGGVIPFYSLVLTSQTLYLTEGKVRVWSWSCIHAYDVSFFWNV